jgi:hypothetical protein
VTNAKQIRFRTDRPFGAAMEATHTYDCSAKTPMSAKLVALLRAHLLRPIIAP